MTYSKFGKLPVKTANTSKDKGAVRRSQLITTYGVGSIVAFGDESFTVAGLDRWDAGNPNLFEPRLQQLLRVQGFVLPPAAEDRKKIPVIRFPDMHYCPGCNLLDSHNFFSNFDSNKCNKCKQTLVPSRFIVCCSRGHMDEFPYFKWVHAGTVPNSSAAHRLTISSKGASASLRDIEISCSCGKFKTMNGAFLKSAFRNITRCSGRRPWLGDEEECTEIPRTLLRGASNVYFPEVASAISIPPWSEGVYNILGQHWTVMKAIPDTALATVIQGMGITEGTSFSVDDLVMAIRQRKQNDELRQEGEVDRASFLGQEYEALIRGKKETHSRQEFVCEEPESGSTAVKMWFDKIMAVKRLREVRVLTSFTRLLPFQPGEEEERKAKLSVQPMDWLPAIQVIGEGVFLKLNEERLSAWENRSDVIARARKIALNYLNRCQQTGSRPVLEITPRYLLIHSLAHILINEWALAAGYPAASLRERLYAEKDMAGFLIYTATSDSAGSLGGLVAQAHDVKLRAALEEAVARASWCSSDPLCIETDATGTDALNLAACHACLLLPEVSCENNNIFLDRALLVGTPDNPELAFFTDLLERN